MTSRLLLLLALACLSCVSTRTMRAEEVAQEQPAYEPRPRHAAAVALESDALEASRKGDFSRAVSLLERGLRLAPKDARLWLSMAEVHAAEGEWAKAETLAARAASLAPSGDPTREEARALEKKARRRR